MPEKCLLRPCVSGNPFECGGYWLRYSLHLEFVDTFPENTQCRWELMVNQV